MSYHQLWNRLITRWPHNDVIMMSSKPILVWKNAEYLASLFWKGQFWVRMVILESPLWENYYKLSQLKILRQVLQWLWVSWLSWPSKNHNNEPKSIVKIRADGIRTVLKILEFFKRRFYSISSHLWNGIRIIWIILDVPKGHRVLKFIQKYAKIQITCVEHMIPSSQPSKISFGLKKWFSFGQKSLKPHFYEHVLINRIFSK